MATSREGAPIERPAEPDPAFAPNAEPDLVELFRNALSPRYDIERPIGRGGSAYVLLARDRAYGDAVAIKVLRPELAEALSASRFLLEIEIARRLAHPRILPVRDAGSAAGVPYYVMKYVGGGTLRGCLRRERQLPIAQTLRIARAVADALDHAHALGVVHRDINPANILLDGDEIVVADFGIARALTLAAIGGPAAITVGTPSGVALGTPEYMSPEQATADRALDHRADVYALGCVIYEMLGGEPPFTGPSSAAIIARHCVEAPRSLRVIRPQLPRPMERAIERSLSKVPADRFASAGELVTTLERAWTEHVEHPPAARWPWLATRRGPAIAVLASTVIVAAAVPVAWQRRAAAVNRAALAADSNAYLVHPEAGGAAARSTAEAAAAALRRWDGIRVVAGAAVGDAARSAAVAAGAGREFRVEATTVGDSLRVRLTLTDTRRDSVLGQSAATLPARADASSLAPLVDALLFGSGPDGAAMGTTSFAARRAYGLGVTALGRWELARADSELVASVRADPRFAAAQLRLAMVRQWAGLPVDEWSFAEERALDGASRLAPFDRTVAQALSAMAAGDRPSACARWRALTRSAPRDWMSWYGLGDCLAYDSVVVRDGHDPARWQFRTSMQDATTAFRQAFELVPAVSGDWVRQAQTLLHVSTSWLREGRAADGDRRQFVASASWNGDSLELRPVPADAFDAGGGRTAGRADRAALEARRTFHAVARAWRARHLDDPEALEAVAVALDLLANPDAIDTLVLVRAQAHMRGDRVRLGTLEVWLRAKYALPDRVDALARARALADSLLAAYAPVTATEAGSLASLAALTGRATLAARYSNVAMSASTEPAVAGTGPALVALASLGGPPDTLRALAAATEGSITSGVLPADRDQLRIEWLVRSALLAIPDSNIAALVPRSDRPPIDLLTAWRAHDLPRARAILAQRRGDRLRASLHVADVTIDAVFGEAAVLASLGDRAGAAAWLDPTLDSLSLVAPRRLSDPVRAGALVRAMALRADVAAAVGDGRTARRWARAVATLCSDETPFLAPVLHRMRLLAR